MLTLKEASFDGDMNAAKKELEVEKMESDKNVNINTDVCGKEK